MLLLVVNTDTALAIEKVIFSKNFRTAAMFEFELFDLAAYR